ncbi:VWA domain-containing protein [Nannocystis sp. ILAH1]|uniref:vWA domain-containing protein n=1 Tax=unclassified Nannocystis TaxID=2627009 RepID=UPI00226D8D63|nr:MULTISPECIES: vWA domain-containing protein [unclassified Nannocystis]MCY0993212.1 VWA domain-containing protein [Nannocystis sp. ILAH1]MCY1063355.1 VWA domain-containing protein [Nannocystis sp. RBIL2]
MQRPLFVTVASVALLSACPGEDNDTAGANSTPGTTGIELPPPTGTTTGTTEPDAPTTVAPTSTGPDTGTTTEDGPLVCDEFVPMEIEPVIPRVVLVLDKSGSMISEESGFWDHDADPNTPDITRWMSLHSVVESIFAGLDNVINFGAVLFPSLTATGSYGPAACPVDADPLVPIGPQSGAAILGALPPADTMTIAGGTPAAAGIQVALDELASLQDDEPKFIILVTDGAANCKKGTMTPELFNAYDDNLPMVVAEAAAMGFPTYVIGIDIEDVFSPTVVDGNPDNTNTYEKLNELAELGGTARPGEEKFYNALNQTELQAALNSITQQVVSCEIKLGEPVPKMFYIQRVEVGSDGDADQQVYEGQDTQVANCDDEAGWKYTTPDRDAIILCGDACEYYKETGVVQIEYGCFIG